MKDITKPCGNCGALNWSPGPDPRCRPCRARSSRERRAADPEAARAKERATPEETRVKYRVTEKAWRDAHPEMMKNIILRHHYGISLTEYNRMLAEQNGCCAICHKPETTTRRGKLRTLGVDHDHSCCPGSRSCGKCIRGLLCSRCNGGLGCFGDDPSLLTTALEYLKIRSVSWAESASSA